MSDDGLFAGCLNEAIKRFPHSRILVSTFLGDSGGFVPNDWDGSVLRVVGPNRVQLLEGQQKKCLTP